METIFTEKKSLTNEIEVKLNKQVEQEAIASQHYLAFASWLHTQGLEGTAKFMYQHAEEERMHMMKLIKYINDVGGQAQIPAIPVVRNAFTDLKEVLDLALEHELSVSRSINRLVEFCLDRKDFGTLQFLQWFVEEQREEEKITRRIQELYRIIGTQNQGIWLFDKAVSELTEQPA
ncbi:MAG: ferritin [Flammeovirgaceae bacterium]